MRLTEYDRVRKCYVIKPDAKMGQNIQKLGMYEDRDEPRRIKYAESKSPDAEFECGACGADVGCCYVFCPWCGQRLKEEARENDKRRSVKDIALSVSILDRRG